MNDEITAFVSRNVYESDEQGFKEVYHRISKMIICWGFASSYRKCNIKHKIMRNFTLRKGFLESNFGTRSSFKGFVMLVVMLIMTASSAMAEVVDGLRYNLDSETKTATLLPKKNGYYSGDIVVPEKVKGNDGVVYVVTAFEDRWRV